MQIRRKAEARHGSSHTFSASPEPILAVMLLDAAAERQLRELLQGRARILACRTTDELIHTLASTHVDLIMCALANPTSGESLLNTVLEIRIGFPNIPLVVACSFIDQQRAVRDLLAAGRALVDDAYVHGQSPGAIFERTLVQARTRSARRWVTDTLARSLPPLCRAIWSHSLRAPRPLSSDEIANAMGMKTRTLRSQLARERLPPLGELALWGRLLAAARLLDDPGHSVAYVAEEMGFGSAGALRAAIKRHFHMTPAQLRLHGSIAPALRAFLRRIGSANREQSRVWTR